MIPDMVAAVGRADHSPPGLVNPAGMISAGLLTSEPVGTRPS